MAGNPRRLFRAVALERLSSPERLDTLMEVTTLKGWMALAALGAVVVGALSWGVFGRIPEAIAGSGLMIREGGLFRVQSNGAGQIEQMVARPGTPVHKGEVVAILAQPELQTAVAQTEVTLEQLRRNRAATVPFVQSSKRLELASIDQQQKQADATIVAARDRVKYLDDRIALEAQALKRGLLTPDAAQGTIAQRGESEQQLMGALARKQELAARVSQLTSQSSQTVFTLDQQIWEAEHRLAAQKEQFAAAANVTSAYDGVVVEQLVDAGQAISSHTPIVTLESSTVPIQVSLFIPLEGKRIRPGMRVEMVPGGVKPEESGYFLGTVHSVSLAPISGTALHRYLKNDVLVNQFTSRGGAYLVDVTVDRNPATPSGFAWTTGDGPPMTFGSGTLLDGKIVIQRRAPIALVIPALRRWLGV
ncbi:MAG: NHLP bacteriocin system secretion protein [Gemmatimonadota bacterium]